MARIELLDPTLPAPARSRELAPRLGTPDGKTVGLRVCRPSFAVFMDRFEELLQARYRPEGIMRVGQELTTYDGSKASPRAEGFFERADWAVLGIAACGASTPWCIHDTVEAQKRGIPTVTVVTEEFHRLAKALAKAQGYPELPMVVVPHPLDTKGVEEVRAIAEAKFEEIVAKAASQVMEPARVARPGQT